MTKITAANLFKDFFKRFPRHLIVAASAWISRAVSAFIQIISVRALLLYLGEERYAVYVIVYSLIGWFSLCDLGFGYATQNFISECRAKKTDYSQYLRALLQIISVVFILSVIILLPLSTFIQSKLLINYNHISDIKNLNIIFIMGFIFILTAFVNIAYKIFYALQKGYISNILPALGILISMFAIISLNRYSIAKGSVLAALLAFTVPQALIASITFIKTFKGEIKNLFKIDYSIIKELLIRSLKFGGLAIMVALTLQIDYIIMSQTVTPLEITTYNILNKIFFLFLFIYSSLLLAVWPVFSELYAKGEYNSIKNMIKKYIIFGCAIVLSGSFVFYAFSDNIIGILAPNIPINPPIFIFILFTIYCLLRIWTDIFSTFLQSINTLKIFWISVPLQAVISITAQYFLSIKYGIRGILIGLILSFIFTNCLYLPYKTWQIFKSKERRNAI